GGRVLDEARDVAIAARALDQVRAAVEQPVERHVPARRVAAADAAQRTAALVREPALRGEAEEAVALIEEADRARPGAGRFEHHLERPLERLLGRRHRRRHLAEPVAERRWTRAGPRGARDGLDGRERAPAARLAEDGHRRGSSNGRAGVWPPAPRLPAAAPLDRRSKTDGQR